MGVIYSVGELNHLYTFFVQWSPDMYTTGIKKCYKSCYVRKDQHTNHHPAEGKVFAAVGKLFSNAVNKFKTVKIWNVRAVNDRRFSFGVVHKDVHAFLEKT
ncbi:hypothetical protein ATANTOWER_014346 [Ataeniobius toweri]|uniref:Uncharacterized protein n=1 Tax=Ataeniobius toweri TaxID=208326 RepID=A0ABU7C7J2_9TELE|nr:hypothetical protein [Ataeniobius toweri]